MPAFLVNMHTQKHLKGASFHSIDDTPTFLRCFEENYLKGRGCLCIISIAEYFKGLT